MDQTIWKKDIKELEEILEKEGLAVVQNSPDPKDLWILRKSDVVKAAQASFPWQKLVTKWTTPVKLIETLSENNKSLKRKLVGVRKSRKSILQKSRKSLGYIEDLEEYVDSCNEKIKDLEHQIEVLKEKISDLDPIIKNPLPRKKKRFIIYGTPMDVAMDIENHLIITPEIESSEKVKGDAVDMPEEVEKETKDIINPLPFEEPKNTQIIKPIPFINKYPNQGTTIFYYPKGFEKHFSEFNELLKDAINCGFEYIKIQSQQFCAHYGWYLRELPMDIVGNRKFVKFIIIKSSKAKTKNFKPVCKIIVN